MNMIEIDNYFVLRFVSFVFFFLKKSVKLRIYRNVCLGKVV